MNDALADRTEERMYIEWDEKLTTGMEIVDTQHRGLIHILNGLYRSIGEGRGEAALHGIFGELQRYADYHFDTEERLLKKLAAAPHHLAEYVIRHVAYRRRIADLRARHDEGEHTRAHGELSTRARTPTARFRAWRSVRVRTALHSAVARRARSSSWSGR